MKPPIFFRIIIAIISAFSLWSCTPAVVTPPRTEAPVLLKPVPPAEWPILDDDSDWTGLEAAVTYSLNYLKSRPAEEKWVLADGELSRREVAESLALFLKISGEAGDRSARLQKMKEVFQLYRWVQGEEPTPLLMTGYYEPTLQGRRAPDPPFVYPVYRLPEDMVFIQAGKFNRELEGRKWTGRLKGNQVLPYYTRQEIDQEGALQGKGLELLWVDDPILLFFMQIQGSGQVVLEDGTRVNLGYGGANGHPYFPIGRELVRRGLLKPSEVSLQTLYAFLRDNPGERQALMNLNASYVFFREVQGGPFGSLGVPLTPGRSVAVDSRYFPPGGLGWIKGLKPVMYDRGRIGSWVPFGRWVCFQDSGGAIKGPSRLDLFWGNGPEAEMAAGHLRHQGSVFILLKK
jgi:membrane-bound lytic murein transglycosylase A